MKTYKTHYPLRYDTADGKPFALCGKMREWQNGSRPPIDATEDRKKVTCGLCLRILNGYVMTSTHHPKP